MYHTLLSIWMVHPPMASITWLVVVLRIITVLMVILMANIGSLGCKNLPSLLKPIVISIQMTGTNPCNIHNHLHSPKRWHTSSSSSQEGFFTHPHYISMNMSLIPMHPCIGAPEISQKTNRLTYSPVMLWPANMFRTKERHLRNKKCPRTRILKEPMLKANGWVLGIPFKVTTRPTKRLAPMVRQIVQTLIFLMFTANAD